MRVQKESIRTTSKGGFDIDLYWKDVSRYSLLTRLEEIALFHKMKKGDREARLTLITSNLRLVVKIAGDYANYGLPFADLISEGNIGLMTAVDRFKLGKGTKLSTYAALWIRQRMRRALSNQSRVIRLPVHITGKLSKITQARQHLRDELGRDSTNEETAKAIGVSLESVNYYDGFRISNISHLDSPVSGDDDDSMSFGDIIADEAMSDPAQRAEDFSEWRNIRGVLHLLTERERDIICRRFGIDCRRETLEEIGNRHKITRERIRQVEGICLKKLRRFLELQQPKPDYRGRLSKPKLLIGNGFVSANQPLTIAS